MATTTKDKKDTDPSAEACSNCRAPKGSPGVPKLSACSRCGLVLYCSRDCQRAHWKACHKECCVAKADRVPQKQDSMGAHTDAASRVAASGEECIICLEALSAGFAITLQCTHKFHAACVEKLRQFGVKQTCSLCRKALPPGPEKQCEDAAFLLIKIDHLVEQGKASWDALPAEARREIDTTIFNLRAAAYQGYEEAACSLGFMYLYGHGLAQSDAMAAKWFRKAANKGSSDAQVNLVHLVAEGRGVSQSFQEAYEWYKKAAAQEDIDAECALGSFMRRDWASLKAM